MTPRAAVLRVALLVVFVAILSSCGMIAEVEEAKKMQITTPEDLGLIRDGTYSGSHTAGPVSVSVDVTMAGGRFRQIEITQHRNGKGDAAEPVVSHVIRDQSLEVDAISGATVSSKVILKAIATALENAPRSTLPR